MPGQNQLGRLFHIMLVIWDAFSGYQVLRKVRVTEELQERMSDRNVALLKYLSGEQNDADFAAVVKHQFESYRQTPVLAFVVGEIVHNESGIFNLPLHLKGHLITCIKTDIDCLDHVVVNGRGETF